MSNITDSRYIVLDKQHIEAFVPPHIIERLNDTLAKVGYHLPVVENYIVINKKEPYANIMEDIVKQHKGITNEPSNQKPLEDDVEKS